MQDRFWKNVDKTDTCWNWMAYKVAQGYGRFMPSEKKCVYAHRYSYEMNKGPIKPGLMVRHTCHNKACVRPDHLELGTHQDNMNDGRKKLDPRP